MIVINGNRPDCGSDTGLTDRMDARGIATKNNHMIGFDHHTGGYQ
jgi:hypothetical protein